MGGPMRHPAHAAFPGEMRETFQQVSQLCFRKSAFTSLMTQVTPWSTIVNQRMAMVNVYRLFLTLTSRILPVGMICIMFLHCRTSAELPLHHAFSSPRKGRASSSTLWHKIHACHP